MVKIDSLEFLYKKSEFCLNIPEVNIKKNEKIAVIGASGTGKTTLLKLISGIQIPSKGIIKVDNKNISDLTDSKRRDFRISNVGFIFQDFELLEYINVEDNILHPFRITKTLELNAEIRLRARKLATELGIENKLKNFIGNLSQGEKQRTAICRALLVRPKIILADEATGNLDPKNKIKILDALFSSVDKYGSTLIAVTHDHELLNRFDRVLDFNDFCNTEQA
jgi:putative ABC transport system ATP-binding protein